MAHIYVDGDVHTQTIDGFFGLFKSGVRGAHHAVSHKWLQGYLNEWTWRYNHREDPGRCSSYCLGGRRRRGLAARSKTSKMSLRFGTGISKPLRVVCLG
jgi:hypothetical protein